MLINLFCILLDTMSTIFLWRTFIHTANTRCRTVNMIHCWLSNSWANWVFLYTNYIRILPYILTILIYLLYYILTILYFYLLTYQLTEQVIKERTWRHKRLQRNVAFCNRELDSMIQTTRENPSRTREKKSWFVLT